MADYVRVDVEAGVATLRLDRPPVNALNAQMQDEVRAAADDLAGRADVRAVVLWGGDRAFAAGADVKEMAELSGTDMAARSVDLQAAFTAVARLPKPVVAAVTGYALGGGCELALCADVRVAADDARLGQPEILLGVIPGAGGTQRLARLIGPARAKDLIFTGRMVGAAEALGMGLVDQVVPAADVYATAHAWAARFAAGPAVALAAAKQAIDEGLDRDLAGGLELERTLFAALFDTADQKAGMRSFVERGPGKAAFTGR